MHFGDTQNPCCEPCGKMVSAPRRAAGAGAPAEPGPAEEGQLLASPWEGKGAFLSQQAVCLEGSGFVPVHHPGFYTSPGKIPRQPAVQSEALAWPEATCWGAASGPEGQLQLEAWTWSGRDRSSGCLRGEFQACQ